MTNEEIAVKLAQYEQHIKSNTHRIDELETEQKEINKLVLSIDRLANSVKAMADEQKKQGEKIEALEGSKNETVKYWLRTILTAVATGVIGFALAMIFK